MIFLLAGNPNVGKSTFFNLITQSHVHVGNYSGVTVEKRVHHVKGFEKANLVDLPGTYNVSPNSEDEGVVTYSILKESYNGIVNIVDSTHLKRNLHLTVQLLELGVPSLVVLNMKDALKSNGYVVDHEKLAKRLNANVMSISARERNKEDHELFVNELKNLQMHKALELNYPQPIKWGLQRIHDLLRHDTVQVKKKWLALQILEGNEGVFEYIDITKEDKIREVVLEVEKRIIESDYALSLKGAIFNARREFIVSAVDDCLIQVEDKEHSKYYNQKIDRFMTHPVLGIPIFFAIMLLVYQISFGSVLSIGTFLTDLFGVFWEEIVTRYVGEFLLFIGVDGFAYGLVVDGILAGVGGVLTFLPQIIVLFFLLAILEGTGYMARVAIVMDRFLSKFGFNGKSIVPMITGLGCTVPAIMATRTIADKKERILTILTIPFISCSARLPIYVYIITAFDALDAVRPLVMLGLYLLGIVVTLFSAKLLSLSYFKGSGSKFILEVPQYRMPQLRTITYQALSKAKRFVKKAGTFILIGSIILWLMSNIGPGGIEVDMDESYLSIISGFIAPIFSPLGFGDWQATSSLISGFLAKEVIVSSLEILYAGNIAAAFTTLSALAYVAFASLYIPCISTVATIKSETGSTKWTLFSVVYPFIVAYLVALTITGIGLGLQAIL